MDFESILDRIKEKKKRLDKSRPLPKPVLENLRNYFLVEWTYNSNAIEGNSLTLRETQLVLQEGITIKGKSLREHFEAKNHEKAIKYLETLVTKKKKGILAKEIFSLHELVLAGIEEDYAGRYRNGQVRITGANFVPPNSLKVPDLMKELFNWVNKNSENLDLVTLVTKFHHKFVWIHPFFDGNGRTARLAMNLFLMQAGFPPSVILKNDRKKYYEALNQANNGSYDKLILLIAQTVERSLDMYLEAIETKSKAEYVFLSKLAKKFPFSQEYLSLMARSGKIDAYKQGRNWVSNEIAIEKYLNR